MSLPSLNPGPQRLAYDLAVNAFGDAPEDRISEVHFGGAKGGGKTYLIVLKALRAALTNPTARCVILRPTYPQLVNIIATTRDIYPAFGGEYRGPQADNPGWTFPNGGRVLFGYLDKETGSRWQGQNLTHAFVDEAGELESWNLVANVKKELRSSTGVNTLLVLSSNPMGVGDAWINQRYMVGAEPVDMRTGDQVVRCLRMRAEDGWRLHIPSRLIDNPKLIDNDPTYIPRLKAAYEHQPAKLQALLEGVYGLVEAGVIWPECTMVDMPATPLDRMVWAWDTAYEVKANSSYSAGVLMGDYNGHLYVLEVVRVKMEFDALETAIRDAHLRHPSAEVWIEGQASGKSLAQALRNVHRVKCRDVAAATIGGGGKYDRQRLMAMPLFKSPLRVVQHQHWTRDYVSELQRQPHGPADQADATVLAIWALLKAHTAQRTTPIVSQQAADYLTDALL
jgi:predicted phage terminase large subunit-like protein